MTPRARIFIALLSLVGGGLWADQVEMQNGDRYAGTVFSILDDFLKQSATSTVPTPPGTNGAPSTVLVR